MRYLVGFVFVLAALAALPQSVNAQRRSADEQKPALDLEWLEGSDLQWLQWLLQVDQRVEPERRTWPPPPPSGGSWLRLELGFAGMRLVPRPPPVVPRFVPRPPLEVPEREEKSGVGRAKIGLGVSVTAMVVGLAVSGGAAASSVCISFDPEMPCPPPPTAAIGIGIAMMVGGLGGTIASGILLRRRKRDQDSLRQAHYGTPRRAQWDLAQSRLVF